MSQEKINKLTNQWKILKSDDRNQSLRIRDAALILKVSEAELLSTKINDEVSYLIVKNLTIFLQEIFSIGQLMLLVRNKYAVHEIIEKHYTINEIENKFLEIKSNNAFTLLDSSAIEFIFYESTKSHGRVLYNFQLFDKNGDAIIKIYLKNDNIKDFEEIKNRYSAKYNFELQNIKSKIKLANLQPTAKTFMKLNNSMYAKYVNKTHGKIIYIYNFKALKQLLDKAVEKKLHITIGITNTHAIQIFKGQITKVKYMYNWLNILDGQFNLHIKDSQIDLILTDQNSSYLESFSDDMHILHLSL